MENHKDRVEETSTTTGTGNFTVAGATTGNVALGSVYAVGDRMPYCIEMQDKSEWEVGEGTYSATNTLQRDRVIANHAGTTAKISFSAGTKNVFVSITGEDANIMGRVLAMQQGLAGP